MLKPSLFVALLPFLVSIGQFSAEKPKVYTEVDPKGLASAGNKVYQFLSSSDGVKMKYNEDGTVITKAECVGKTAKSAVKLFEGEDGDDEIGDFCFVDLTPAGSDFHSAKNVDLCSATTDAKPAVSKANIEKITGGGLLGYPIAAGAECSGYYIIEKKDTANTIKPEKLETLFEQFQVESQSGGSSSEVLTELKEKAGKKMLQGTLAITIIVLIFLIIGFVALLAIKK